MICRCKVVGVFRTYKRRYILQINISFDKHDSMSTDFIFSYYNPALPGGRSYIFDYQVPLKALLTHYRYD